MGDTTGLVQSLLTGIALLGGLWLSLSLSRAKGLNRGLAFRLMAWAAPLILVGGKGLYILEHRGFPRAAPWAESGYSLYGSFFLVVLFWVLVAWLRPFPLLTFLDCVTPAAAFALVVGRINCFVRGCCAGTMCDWPWGVRFRAGTQAFSNQVQQGLIRQEAPYSLPVHPTQLYEGLFALVFGLVLLRLVRSNHRPGVVFFVGLLGYSLFRLGVETVRIRTDVQLLFGGWTFAQVSSFGSAVVALLWLTIWPYRRVPPGTTGPTNSSSPSDTTT